MTLGQFSFPIPLTCHHCDKKLPKRSTVEVQSPYVLVQCPYCSLITPFKVIMTRCNVKEKTRGSV